MPTTTEMVSLAIDPAGEPMNDTNVVPSRRKDYLIGIALLLVVVLLWTSSNFVTQALFVGGYHKPFLVTYLNTSSFTFYLLPFLVRYTWLKGFGKESALPETSGQYEILPTSEHSALENPPIYTARAPFVPTDVLPEDNTTHLVELPPLTISETARLASIFCFFWFIANWSLNASLDYTSVASSTILSGTSGFFTLVIGRLFSVESLTPTKIAAVATSFGGILLVSLSDSNSSSPHSILSRAIPPSVTAIQQTYAYRNLLLGDFLAILASIFYALYVILLKIRIRSESRIDMQLFFGFVGLFNILALFPIGVLLHLTGNEPFELPSTRASWGGVLVNMFITLSSDYIYVIAMLKTTPLLVTIGLSLTIPLAIVGDEILNKPTKTQAVLGALLVLGGFGLIGWESNGSGPRKQGHQPEDVHSEVEAFQREPLDNEPERG